MENKAPPNDVEGIFKKIIEGERSADLISLEVNESFASPQLAYNRKTRHGLIRLPWHHDLRVMAEWIAHEYGHFEYYQLHPLKKFEVVINTYIRLERTPEFVASVVRKLYYLIYWPVRMKRELYAHQTSIRLIKKIGLSLDVFELSQKALSELVPPWPKYDFVENYFRHRMQLAQKKYVKAAQGIY